MQSSPAEIVKVWKLIPEDKSVLRFLLILNCSKCHIYSVLQSEKQFKNAYCTVKPSKVTFRENRKIQRLSVTSSLSLNMMNKLNWIKKNIM